MSGLTFVVALNFVCLLAVAVAFGVVGALRLPTQWKGYVAVGLLVAGVYLYSLLEAVERPWTLWKRSWMQDSGRDAEQHELGKYAEHDVCLKEQWKKLNEEAERQKQVDEFLSKRIKPSDFHSVHLVEGRTGVPVSPVDVLTLA